MIKYLTLIMLMVANTLTSTKVFSQDKKDTTDHFFHDDLLDHLVGNWSITSFAHGSPFTAVMEGGWVLNHQFFHIHFKSNEPMPNFGIPMEYEEYIGYNHKQSRYPAYGASIEGSDNFEGFCYAFRQGNELKFIQKENSTGKTIIQHLIWEPESGSWIIQSRPELAGKEGKIFLDMKLVKQL